MADADGGIGRLNRRLAAIPQAVRAALQAPLDKSAEELARKMRQNVPTEDGTLKATIRVEPGYDDMGRAIRAGGPATTKDTPAGRYDYALAQELGTQEMPANPFFYAAKRELAKRINNRLKREARKAIKKHWGQK